MSQTATDTTIDTPDDLVRATDTPADFRGLVIDAPRDERVAFIRRTYAHLVGAVMVFVALEAAIQATPGVEGLVSTMVRTPLSWIGVLIGFVVVGRVVDLIARSAVSLGTQYLALTIYVLAEAILFVPLIYVARLFEERLDVSILLPAAVGTLVIFGVLTIVVLTTRKDFSFLGAGLRVAGLGAVGLIVVYLIYGRDLGLLFTLAMVLFASLYVLYYTSNVMHHYRTDQHVVASLALFASLALLFWYILRLALYVYSRGR